MNIIQFKHCKWENDDAIKINVLNTPKKNNVFYFVYLNFNCEWHHGNVDTNYRWYVTFSECKKFAIETTQKTFRSTQ